MSLIDLILGQKTIIITIGVAGLLLFAALTVALLPRVRQRRARAAQRRAEQAQLAAAKKAEEQAEQKERRTPAAARKQAAATAAASPTAPLPPPPPAKPAAPPAAPAAPATATAVASTEAAAKPGEETPSDMQDILSSVFSDEGTSERQIALMRGLSDVDISHLLTLSQQVAAQIRGGNTITVVNSKELE